jgi:hypothetical protein
MNVVKYKDPKTDLNIKRSYAVIDGPRYKNWSQITSTSYSNDTLTFNTPPPNKAIIVSPFAFIGLRVQLVLTGDSGADNVPLVNYGYTDSLRACPINSCISSLQCTFNNNTITVTPFEYYPDLLNLGMTHEEQYKTFSNFPSMPDNFQHYSMGVGTVQNCMGGIGSSSFTHKGRGTFPVYISANSRTTATINFFVIEPIFLSPFLVGDVQGPGFIGLNTLQWTFNFNDFSRMWCRDENAPSVTCTGTIVSVSQPEGLYPGSPTLYLEWITPSMKTSIPQSPSYAYYTIQKYVTNVGNVTSGQSLVVNSQSIQLQTIPKMIIIYARRRNADRSITTTDTYARIKGINLTWQNYSGILGNATVMELYQIAKENGIIYDMHDWIGDIGEVSATTGGAKNFRGAGSILPLKFGKDIGLDPNEAPGLNKQFTLSFNINMENISNSTINYDLYCVTITEGVFKISQDIADTKLGITQATVDRINQMPEISYTDIKSRGGNSWSKTLSTVLDTTSKLLPAIESGVELFSGLGEPSNGGCGPSCGCQNCQNISKGMGLFDEDGETAGMDGGALMDKPLLKRRRLENR